METTNKVLQLLADNWEAVAMFLGWVGSRLIRTEKDYDLLTQGIKLLGRAIDFLVPNRRKDSLGNPKGK